MVGGLDEAAVAALVAFSSARLRDAPRPMHARPRRSETGGKIRFHLGA